jgi:hypothetical protein
MSKTEFQHYICLPFCDFYKPGAKEELLCRGAWLVERMVDRERLRPGDFQGLGNNVSWPPDRKADLEAVVCAPCPFRMDDCDFQSPHPPEGARPCGGLLLLAQLLAAGRITLRELAEAAD